jgi:hypothetical protein
MIRLGDQLAMTDEEGRFRFARVNEGPHALDVDMNTVPTGRLLRDSIVRTVTVVNGRPTDVQMSLVRGGRLAGRVLWYDDAVDDSSDSAPLVRPARTVLRGPAPNAVVILRSNARSVSVLADAEGAFMADGLVPGKWQVALSPLGIPSTHAGGSMQTVVVAPGGEGHAELRIAPRTRHIHMLDLDGGTSPAAAANAARPVATPPSRPAPRSSPSAGTRRSGRKPAPRVEVKRKPCPWPIVRPNGPICEEPSATSLPRPIQNLPDLSHQGIL